ncbi:hypothetical protein HCN44_009943 [Aphidius gifuensis]|uniref:HIG1 domain-containing protein n=1 Tax=Aphidius gifuensis TaxID=684658 RepID=A0A834XL67_APHGI|nr:HIG1 domain family member 2A, mitochondrial [Aphidius gifuensis]KAF7988298.1 hypothetical protein HCN44_009943 [Aphidius gifuensis]
MADEKGIRVPDLDWIQLRKDMGSEEGLETYFDKMKKKMKENPLIGVGCVATLAALSFGLWNFQRGNQQMSQYMMRARVIAQGFTIFVAAGSLSLAAAKKKQEEKQENS